MKTQAAVAFEAGKPLEICDVDLEGPKEGEVLVELKATGVCHTDAFTLTFDENYESISNSCSEQVIISNGISKWCGAGGWRLGYFIIPNQLNEIKIRYFLLALVYFYRT